MDCILRIDPLAEAFLMTAVQVNQISLALPLKSFSESFEMFLPKKFRILFKSNVLWCDGWTDV